MRIAIATRIVIVSVVAIVAIHAVAIEQEGGLQFIVAEPQGAFGDAIDGAGYGLDAHYGVRVRQGITVGLGLHGMIYGSESTHQELPLVDGFDLTTTNNLAGGYLFARVQPLSGAVQPYGEARLGLNYLWTESKLEDDGWWHDDEIAHKTNYDDTAAFSSVGAGLLIRLRDGDHGAKKPGVYLDLGATYQHGAKAKYLTEGDIALVDDRPVFSPTESATSMWSYAAGAVVTF